jgi:hypothetical protein
MDNYTLTITVTEDILEQNPDLRDVLEVGEEIEVSYDRPKKPPHNG